MFSDTKLKENPFLLHSEFETHNNWVIRVRPHVRKILERTGWNVGETMKEVMTASQGHANPKLVRKLIDDIIQTDS